MPAGEALLRKLTLIDIPAALELSGEAGWNQTEQDWRTLIDLAPESCLGIEVDGQLVSTATLMCYGAKLAWVGMVLTCASHRGRGYAKRLLTETLRLADALGMATVKLDATDQGQPLYEKLGFRPEQAVERWESAGESPRQPSNAGSNRISDAHLDMDQAAFGADRSALLKRLSKQHFVFAEAKSFLFTRAGRTHSYLGPCVADSVHSARHLFQTALSSDSSTRFYWDIVPSNAAAVSLAREFAFTPKRQLLRMVRGQDLRTAESQIYGLAGFEFG